MKYISVIMGFIIMFLYALFGYQLDRIKKLSEYAAELEVRNQTNIRTISMLEDYREELRPPETPAYTWPIIKSEFLKYSSFYGPRMDPLRANTGGGRVKFHAAVDMTGIPGARVQAVSDGTVIDKWYDKGWHAGRPWKGHEVFNGYLIIQHDDGMISHYGHISDILVHENDRVTAGQTIARISQAREIFSTGPHLDFRLQDREGNFVNPLLWIGRKGEKEM
jgi:murein DD-endopeptidase MepM/ murein hydrolase activator NlpD